MSQEVDNIRTRYEGRKSLPESLYDPLKAYNSLVESEKRFALIRWLNSVGLTRVSGMKVLEVGCGKGPNLLQLLLLGFKPENLVGVELIEEFALQARHRLPSATRIIVGDASEADLNGETFDVVMQFTVFTSILDKSFQRKLADRMWSMVKTGGGVLWYDYVYNNPWNPDVRGIPVRKIHELFPDGRIKLWRLTLAPPIGRFVAKISPWLYHLFNTTYVLRTHVLCWIQKV